MSYVKIGVAGPVGSGKTALIEALSRQAEFLLMLEHKFPGGRFFQPHPPGMPAVFKCRAHAAMRRCPPR